MGADALMRLADDPATRRQMQEALDHAATALGLPDQEAVVQLLEEMAQELAFIEALRERLLRPVQTMAKKIERLVRAHGDNSQMENLSQVRRLTGVALKEIERRFDVLDAQTGEVMATLRNANSQRAFIRTNRDWLYRSLRAWQATLDDWEATMGEYDEGTRGLVSRTYRFLAPRFMPVTEWLSPERQHSSKKKPVRQMTW
jgi:chromosome segregation ATPase